MFGRFAMRAATVALGLAIAAPAYAQKTNLSIYTALENEELAPLKAAIEKAVPEVNVVWTRDSTGVITARFLAEKDNPRADIVMGLAASSLLLFKKAGLLAAYTPKGTDKLKPTYVDKGTDAAWLGMDAYIGVVCYNTVEAAKIKTVAPKTWKDLTDPKYKGQLVMPHPASSGTGYLMVAAWIQLWGEEAAWKFMDALHDNIAVYTHSGSAPCVQAAKGERVAGISLDMRAAAEKTKGAPIEVIIPAEGTGWDMEVSAIVKSTKHPELAKKVMDWMATKEANELYSKFFAVVAYPGIQNLPKNYPEQAEQRMVKNDFDWMSANRDRILAEWSKRYETKAAPKN